MDVGFKMNCNYFVMFIVVIVVVKICLKMINVIRMEWINMVSVKNMVNKVIGVKIRRLLIVIVFKVFELGIVLVKVNFRWG